MSYSTANPPALVWTSPAGGLQKWIYSSADAHTAVDDAGYITNALALGMRVGDVVEVIDTSGGTVTDHRVTAVSSSGSTMTAATLS